MKRIARGPAIRPGAARREPAVSPAARAAAPRIVSTSRSPGRKPADARTWSARALMNEAERARAGAYAPYSGFAVGAALLGASGRVYHGCNVENASFGLAICAERTAVFKAVCEGEREFVAIAVTAGAGKPSSPCGSCRQVLHEFAPNLRVHWHDRRGRLVSRPLGRLLAMPFDSAALEKR